MREETLDIDFIKNLYNQHKDILKQETEIVKKESLSEMIPYINSLIENAAKAGQPFVDIDMEGVSLSVEGELAKFYSLQGFEVIATKGWIDINSNEMRHNFLKISWQDLRKEWN